MLEVGPGGKAVIARQADCQTCLLCELHCPADALFVWPDCEAPAGITAEQVLASGQLGAFRRDSGWGEHAATQQQPALAHGLDLRARPPAGDRDRRRQNPPQAKETVR